MVSRSTSSETPGADGQRRLLQPLARFGTEHVGAGEAVAVAQQGQEAVRRGVGVCVCRRSGHVGQAGGGTELSLARADRRGLRVGEHDPRHRLVVGRPATHRGCSPRRPRLGTPRRR